MFQDQNREQQQPRQSRPNTAVLLRKFYRDVQQSRILSEVKKRRFRERPISRRERRLAAIRQAYVKRMRRGY